MYQSTAGDDGKVVSFADIGYIGYKVLTNKVHLVHPEGNMND